MQLSEIYFVVNKTIHLNDVLKQMMHNKLTEAYNTDRNGYLSRANATIEGDKDIYDQINKILEKDNRQYETVTIKSNVKVQANNEKWYMDFPLHDFQINVTGKSIIYKCIKVLDGETFVGFNPSDKAIITLKKASTETVYFNE